MKIAKIAVANAIYEFDKPYDYCVPTDIEKQIKPGMRVIIPFGKGNRTSDGFVLALTDVPENGMDTQALKKVLEVIDSEPVLDKRMLKLAIWMQQHYFCTLYEAARTMLPSGLFYKLKDILFIPDGADKENIYEKSEEIPYGREILDCIYDNGKKAERNRLLALGSSKQIQSAIKNMLEKGLLQEETDVIRPVKDKVEKIAVTNLSSEEADEYVKRNRKKAPKRSSVIELLNVVGAASTKEICYFTDATMETIRALDKCGLITLQKREVFRSVEIDDIPEKQEFHLNEEQEQAFQAISGKMACGEAAVSLLYGVTGSGKTQIYIKLIEKALASGRQALLLVPEIALTPQMLRIFISQFGKRVAVMHSSLPPGKRYDEWKRIKQGKADVVIGTRSAVFAPLDNIGLIIIDEEQEPSYKSENTPRYHARDIAKYRCVQNRALLLLGSATPSVDSFYQAEKGLYQKVELRHRYNQHVLPEVTITDLKKEIQAGNGSTIGSRLESEIRKNLACGEQTVLFLNRRGTSRYVACTSCGNRPECPNCSVTLTYHQANRKLMCHKCGYSLRFDPVCPVCGGNYEFIGAGTQQVVEDLNKLFPEVPVLRMDADMISVRQTHDDILQKFEKENIPILVGTQMVAKGLDFDNVTLVGVINADLTLYNDSYYSNERTFSLLTQVVGRAGRRNKQGRAVIQTMTPENDVILYAKDQDYLSFYQGEIQFRSLRGLPPFTCEFVITVIGADESEVIRHAIRVKNSLSLAFAKEHYSVLGPAPAEIRKVRNRYYYKVTLYAPNNKNVRSVISRLLCSVKKDRESRNITVTADVDPLE